MSNEKAVKGIDVYTDTNQVVLCCISYVTVDTTLEIMIYHYVHELLKWERQ